MKKTLIVYQATKFLLVAAFLTYIYFIAGYNNPFNVDTSVTNLSTIIYKYYWIFAGVILLSIALATGYSFLRLKKGKSCLAIKMADFFIRHSFLLKQLVDRDFKSKYKRSFLGIVWSLLNPLLMMGVQFVIFSTLFGNDSIVNYPVYLLIGVVSFSFVNEASTSGLTAITGNANLLNKVYVPKFIYPLSKVISALINFSLTLIPLVVIMLITGVRPSVTHFLYLLDIIFMLVFAMGLAMLLSSIMVFFRDIQFLWSVIVTVWMYATPIFYDMSFIRNNTVKTVIKLNPLYHYINFGRTVLRDCACPDLSTFVYCGGSALLVFIIGATVFKLSKERFILHI